MKKPVLKRMLLGTAQHILMALIVLAILSAVGSSYVSTRDINGQTMKYRISPFGEETDFQETEAFRSMLSAEVSDLTTMVVIKKQLETDGVYDESKEIDVSEYANRKSLVRDCPVTAVYQLGDLLRWNYYNGLSMEQWTLSKKEFVTYFQDGLLDMDRYYYEEETGTLGYLPLAEEEKSYYELQEESDLRLAEMYDNYVRYNEEQLVELAFGYVASHMDKPIELVVNGNGEEMVSFSMLTSAFRTVDGRLLTQIADNWIDYCILERNVIETIEEISYNYSLYEENNDRLSAENTNLRYYYWLPDGTASSGYEAYTNLAGQLPSVEDGSMDDYFRSMDSYLIYEVGDIAMVTNIEGLSDDFFYPLVSRHSYVYPEGARLYVGMDQDTYSAYDQFAAGYYTYERLTSDAWKQIALIAVLGAAWLSIWLYLTVTAGRAVDEQGKQVLYLNWFDRLFTEAVLLFALILGGIGIYGIAFLGSAIYDVDFGILLFQGLYERNILPAGIKPEYLAAEVQGIFDMSSTELLRSFLAVGGLYGFLASLSFCAMWYSLVRRIKSHNLLKDSFLYWIWSKCSYGASMVFTHRNTAVRTLLPYNLFLIMNLAGLLILYSVRNERRMLVTLVMLALLLLDALVGVLIFRRNAELDEIVETIERIRQGEVDCQIEAERLHGQNREIAEAVNHIGEGIRSAVATSIKDERLKADLITNVSHDIKTPLTSIVNYVDLLKREKITQEPVKSYIEILDVKSQRLKQLTDDLVEASKISSGNIILQKERLNLTELMNQSVGEFSEKLEQRALQVIFEGSELVAFIYADSRRMWRIVENLFNNICKYAMPSTRVYLDLKKEKGQVQVSIKNISENQLNISPEELTERFIRGDVSRSTEGSGLGLSIAKSLTEVQGGSFTIYLDGDLFKVTLEFPEYEDPEDEAPEDEASE